MKNFKLSILAIGAFLLFSTNTLKAQDQMYWIHVDHVKPAMQSEYEKIAKEFADACKTYNIPDFTFNTWRHDDGSYVYSSPMKNFADMDKDALKPLRDKMGEQKFINLFERFDKCYDKHQNFMVTHKSELSYMPDGKLNEGDFREYYFLYVTPSQSKAVAEKLKEVKSLFSKKNSKSYFSILHSGFGTEEEFYVAIVAAKDEADNIQKGVDNNKLLGEDWRKKWNELFGLLNRYETKTSMFRADLSYSSTK
ncbi:hypothetical protein [uncultured Flavobacterium sp.]|uniref:hypothetical protein n=1 Tax=uncultured Flavobacterium sp. TaxID=165435 RepID=UPI0030EB5C5C|tara:strand:- start:165197 stop:165949 length:753 start_codon:yes stop_codon:yes gene_type:complete